MDKIKAQEIRDMVAARAAPESAWTIVFGKQETQEIVDVIDWLISKADL